jgi:hypothetical protein
MEPFFNSQLKSNQASRRTSYWLSMSPTKDSGARLKSYARCRWVNAGPWPSWSRPSWFGWRVGSSSSAVSKTCKAVSESSKLANRGSARSPLSFVIGFKITHTYVEGIQLPRRALCDRGKTGGRIKVGDSPIKSLGRYTPLAELIYYVPDGHKDSRVHLADCHLEWMAEDRFELCGLCIRAPFEDRPEHLLRDGRLCEFDIALPELSRAQRRLLGPFH